MTRTIMTRDELATHRDTSHGRNHALSSDGYDDMTLAEAQKWHAVSGWGRDGWDLGDWPYVAIYIRDLNGTYQMQQIVEGDHDVYTFASREDREAAIDYMFLWYAAGQDWAPLGYEQRATLDAGELEVDPKWRGPFSWDRLEREKAS